MPLSTAVRKRPPSGYTHSMGRKIANQSIELVECWLSMQLALGFDPQSTALLLQFCIQRWRPAARESAERGKEDVHATTLSSIS